MATMLIGCSNGGDAGKADNAGTADSGTAGDAGNADAGDAADAGDQPYIAFSISYTGNDFMQGLANYFEEFYTGKGYKVEVASADGDATTQISQIENFTTMGADLIVVMGVDPTGLTDVCSRARSAGTKIVSFTTQIEGGEDTYVGSASEEEIGAAIAQLGSDWIDATFPDAADGEIQTVVFGYSGTPEAAKRSEGMKAIESNKKVTMTYMEPENNTLDAAQAAAENLFQTNPDVNLILCYNSGMSNGVSAYVMTPGSAVADISKFATFGSDVSAEVMANIEASKNNESVVRGCISLGDYADMFADLDVPVQKLLSGEAVEPAYYGEAIPIKGFEE